MNPPDRPLLHDLVFATQQGDTERVCFLLAQGVRADVVDHASGWSALHAAVIFHPEMLDALLEHGPDLDRPLVMGGTPLSYAVHELGEQPTADRRARLMAILKALLRAGANPRAGAPDQTALELASMYQLPEVETMLRSH